MRNPRHASDCQIVGIIRSAVLLGNDVLNLKWQIVVLLRHPAIFATVMGT